MNRLRCVVLSLAVMLVSLQVVAQEEPAVEVVAESPAAEAVETVVDAVANPVWYGNVELWQLLVGLVVFVWGIVKAKYALDKKWGDQVVEFFEVGVQQAYDSFVREAKKAAPKGKLTSQQIKQAREKAWEATKAYAKSKGVDIAKKIAVERVPVLINSVVNKLKRK